MGKHPSRWTRVYESTKELPPHESLFQALELVREREAALDLGAGAMRDTKLLLKVGFEKVVAVDSEPINQHNEISDDRLEIVVQRFESYDFPEDSFNVVNAQFSLPFTSPTCFNTVFDKLKSSLMPGGIFVGQLFGKNDEWSSDKKMTFHSLEEVQNLFSRMEILGFEEKEQDGTTAAGTQKHWHVFQITARK